MLDVQAESIEPSYELEGRRGPSTYDLDRRGKFPAARVLLERFEDGDPDRRNAAGNSRALTREQSQDAFRVDTRAGEHQARAEHGAREGQAPGVGVKHGSNGQHGIGVMQAKNFSQAASKGVQHESAVGVDDPLRTAGRPGSKPHRSAVAFVEKRVAKIVAGL